MSREAHVRICESVRVRFPRATRLIVCFQYREDALRFQDTLRKRLAKFSLALEINKTRLIEFERFAQ